MLWFRDTPSTREFDRDTYLWVRNKVTYSIPNDMQNDIDVSAFNREMIVKLESIFRLKITSMLVSFCRLLISII